MRLRRQVRACERDLIKAEEEQFGEQRRNRQPEYKTKHSCGWIEEQKLQRRQQHIRGNDTFEKHPLPRGLQILFRIADALATIEEGLEPEERLVLIEQKLNRVEQILHREL